MRRLTAAATTNLLLLAIAVAANQSPRPPFSKNAIYKKEVSALFLKSPHLKRPIAWTRGGSSSSEQEEYSTADVNDDESWMKVGAVLDLESAFFGDVEEAQDMGENDTSALKQTAPTDEVPKTDEISDEISTEEKVPELEANKTKGDDLLLNLTFYASKHGDGSESDPDGLPTRFLTMQKGCRTKAKEAFAATVSWRNQYDINNILRRPHPQFDACKVIFPHYFPGRDPHKNIIFVQRVGCIDMDLAHRNNVTNDDLIMHYVYIVEYCWNLIEPGPPDGIMTNVIDMSGMKFSKLRDPEMIQFAKRFVSIMSSNYPSRSYKTLVINAPKWFNMGYKLFKPLLRESTREKIRVYAGGSEQDEALRLYLGESVPLELLSSGSGDGGENGGMKSSSSWLLPTRTDDGKENDDDQGGNDDDGDDEPVPGPKSRIERELRTFCMNKLEAVGTPMNEVMA